MDYAKRARLFGGITIGLFLLQCVWALADLDSGWGTYRMAWAAAVASAMVSIRRAR